MEVCKLQGVVVIRPTPRELEDIAITTGAVERLLTQAQERKFVVDLGAMDIIFSIQIGTLVAIFVMCREHQAGMRIVTANQKVKALLGLVGLDKMIEVYPELGAAIRGTAPAGTPTPHFPAPAPHPASLTGGPRA